MSPHNVGENEKFESYLPKPASASPDLFVSVPTSLPSIEQRRRPSGLNGSRFGVGVEGPCYQQAPTGQVWAAWVILGIAIAMAIPGVVAVWSTGDWLLVVAVAPFAGLLLLAMVRLLREEQRAKKKKIERMARRLRDMNR